MASATEPIMKILLKWMRMGVLGGCSCKRVANSLESDMCHGRLTSMTYRRYFAPFLILGLLALPHSSKHPALELFSQDGAKAAPAVAGAWDVLVKGVDDNDATHRKAALAATGTIGPLKEAVEMVQRGLQDKDQEVRQTAADTLGEMGAQDAIPSLKTALDDNPEVSFTAAKALWKLGDKESSRDILQEVLEGERKDAPGRLHGAIRSAKKKMTPGQLALMGVKEGSGTFLGPASISVTAIQEAIKEKKTDAGAAGRSIAAELLSKDTDPYSLTLLEWAAGDSNWAVRLAVAKGLGERGNEGSIAKLQPLLSDDHHAVRYMAAASIVKLSQKKQAGTGD